VGVVAVSVTVDAATLARGWLSVATAAGGTQDDAKSRPQLYRTVDIEQHAHGLRLTSTDGYMLLTTWIPERNYELDEPAGLDELPYATAVAIDEYHRGAGLLAHLLKLTKPDDAPKDLDVTVQLNVPWQADGGGDLKLEGLDALAVTVEHPGHERVQLAVYEGGFVRWRTLVLGTRTVRTEAIGLTQTIAQRLAKAAKPHDEVTVIRCWFGGKEKPITVSFGDLPEITGLVMPVRWDMDRDAPYATDAPDEDVESPNRDASATPPDAEDDSPGAGRSRDQ
jgi:hypothetical protein